MSREFPGKDSILQELKESSLVAIETAPQDYKEDFKEIYEERYKLLEGQIDKGYFLYDKDLYNYLGKIINHIKKQNPILGKFDFRFFVTSYPWPNATSLGDGTLLINIGLLQKIENESQLAFILCHEIAHYYLKHSEQKLEIHFEKLNSDDYKQKLKEISKTEYGAYAKSKDLMRSYIYDERKHSREYEFGADSLGLILLQNTSYPAYGAVSCMHLLDTIDCYKFNNQISYKRYFDFPEFPFRERWLEIEESLFGGKKIGDEFFDRDSVKTHPDCDNRAEVLGKLISYSESQQYKVFLYDSSYFHLMRTRADYEVIEGWYFFEDYGRCLFYCLKQLQAQPDDCFLNVKTGTLLRTIHGAQLNYRLNNYVQKPSLSHEEGYNELLEFIDNLRLSELAQIGYYYHKHRETLFESDEEFLYNYIYFCKHSDHQEYMSKLKALYMDRYPNGRFIEAINTF